MLAACTVVAISLCAVPSTIHFGFDSGVEDWKPSPLDEGSRVTIRQVEGRGGVLVIGGQTPPSLGACYRPWRDWRGYEWLSFDLWVPEDAPDDLSVYVYIKDKQYWWYQTPVLHDASTGMRRFAKWRGRWLPIRLDISRHSTIWQPGGHGKAWTGALFYPRELGVRAFSSHKWDGSIAIDDVRLAGNAPPLGRRNPQAKGPIKRGLQVYASGDKVPVYGKVELTFYLDREWENPFDPDVVDVQGHFLAPSGRKIAVPGFYYQDYVRVKDAQGNEKLRPVGGPCWKVRFSPTEQGQWRYYVSVLDALGELRSEEGRFVAGPPQDPRGLVRISSRDPRFFEFDNGEFFYPLGINMRDGGDQAAAQRGLYDFEEYFPIFAEHNIRFVRTWMAAWWAGIEWSERYDSRYDGVGRYCMYNAWRLDKALELAHKYGLFLQLTFNSHGQVRRDKFDAEWKYNPYSVKNGGFVASPAMFFTDPEVKRLFRQRYRYIVARWGYSQKIMAWELWNEVDLVEGYNPQQVAKWHQEMARYLRSIDPWAHLITTHVCLYWVFGRQVFAVPEIEYVQADHYWKRKNHQGLDTCYNIRRIHRKPFLVIEYGPQTVELGRVTPADWRREFRVGMWASNLLPSAMPGVFWYHKQWRQYELWRYQRGLEAFNAGEDRRGAGWEKARWQTNEPKRVAGEVMVGKPGARFYVYNWDNMAYAEPADVPQDRWLRGVELTIFGLADGDYTVQFWDPLEGKTVAEAAARAEGNALRVSLPDFAQELAGKVLPAGQVAETAPAT